MAQERPPTYILLAAAAAIALTVGYYLASRRGSATLTATDQVQTAVQEALAPAAAPRSPAPLPVDPREQQRLVAGTAKAQQKALVDRGAAVRKKLDVEFPAERAAWDKDVEPLLEDDRGKSIAASEAHSQAFFREYQSPRLTPEEAASLSSQLSFLLPPLEEALADPASTLVPDATFTTKLDAIERQATDGVAAYRSRREAILRLVRLAQSENPAASGATLRAANEQRADAREALRVADEHARAEAATTAERDHAARATEEKLASERAEEEERRRAETAATERQRDIRRKASDREFLAAFRPFLARSNYRVGGKQYPIGEHPGAVSDIAEHHGFSDPKSLKNLLRYPAGGTGRRSGLRDGWEAGVERFEDFEAVAEEWVKQCKLLATPADAGKPCTPAAP